MRASFSLAFARCSCRRASEACTVLRRLSSTPCCSPALSRTKHRNGPAADVKDPAALPISRQRCTRSCWCSRRDVPTCVCQTSRRRSSAGSRSTEFAGRSSALNSRCKPQPVRATSANGSVHWAGPPRTPPGGRQGVGRANRASPNVRFVPAQPADGGGPVLTRLWLGLVAV
jgi:hypothetical protein